MRWVINYTSAVPSDDGSHYTDTRLDVFHSTYQVLNILQEQRFRSPYSTETGWTDGPERPRKVN